MRQWYRRRYLDLLGSTSICNEHRGYTAIDRVVEAVRRVAPKVPLLTKPFRADALDKAVRGALAGN